ncbi:hypothetical protein H257_06663 [Aphanomyces astaci]|uniref:RNA helicase n=2 Tax=Aphanomyces astaci TaxID=112090 RepID=W4GKY4_APHAT|nr:hypothetical protein H257_06663 [Aphanomyces astaci]ETV80355.1 hypothetical protein H257_06663 [Aphanomyces astaci]KAF0754658.1 hypothetical protein AaE_005248 [Aphanomyces astaci]|eukprot:XP_009830279.1 hypothetical protein H257_06663 [Aphanomyces astaci]
MDLNAQMEEISREKERVARIARLAEEKYAIKQKELEEEAKKPKFMTQKEREAAALARLQQRAKTGAATTTSRASSSVASKFSKLNDSSFDRHRQAQRKDSNNTSTPTITREQEKELAALKDHYLGKKVNKKKVLKASEKFSKNFQFDWEPTEDTSGELNPLYKRRDVNLLFGRGYMAGVDMREQRKKNNFVTELARKRQLEQKTADEQAGVLTADQIAKRQRDRERELRKMQEWEANREREIDTIEAERVLHWSDKSLENMTDRDWRIFREDFDIILRGGKAPIPLRKWSEATFPESVMDAVKLMGFEKPSPIQMQSIPIGMQRRDCIGIAETGSGKTAAFLIPIICYVSSVPVSMVTRTPDQGPLALVMAPTRELALQIEAEAKRLSQLTKVGEGDTEHIIKTLSVVGGQSIEDQGFKLREGIDILIGTPGRLMDCMQSHYLVLNQCNYVVLDEADRMIEEGFEDQVTGILDNMGGLLKSENEAELEAQLSTADNEFKFRVTMMFSATMPNVVEKLAKTYLRHPAIIKIGDENSGKNKRIDQQVHFLSAGKKLAKLYDTVREILRNAKTKDTAKIIIFVNEKKGCDLVARAVGKEGFYATILHGGKSQDQRDESLMGFRDGTYDILVATDVAGRGLDIPDVTHVINYDVPKEIEKYCHRIGRTGRAGKEGVAISFLTDHDEDIMYDLKTYLEATDMPVPPQLASHPMAKAAAGARDDKGNIISKSKRDTVIYSG